MKIYSVYDDEFKPYGRIIEGYDTAELQEAMLKIPMPEAGPAYQASITSMEYGSLMTKLQNNAYGGMAIEIGMCWGYNTKLNCLEYHRDSELNLGTDDFILLVAKQDEIENGMLDTSKVKAFRVPAGVLVDVFATTLHYAPCQVKPEGFRVAIVLPKGTNYDKPQIEIIDEEDKRLQAMNKWILAHPESSEAKNGAYIGLTGKNIDLLED